MGRFGEIGRKKLRYCTIISPFILIYLAFNFSSMVDIERQIKNPLSTHHNSQLPETVENGELPKGIISGSSDLEMKTLWGTSIPNTNKENGNFSKNLLAMAVGIKFKQHVNKIVKKFLPCNFTVMLFHYDDVVDGWKDFDWANKVIHISASYQTKWWFAKRFLHPSIVSEYNYIFLWDEDIDVQNFHPMRYISIIKEEGLEISQPALDGSKSQVHYQITVRSIRTKVHRRIYKFTGGMRCYGNSTAPPCTGWVEMMVPVFSSDSWRCVWNMIQNDLIHAWGLDMMLGYCAKGDRTQNVGVVDAEYVVHRGIPSLGAGHNLKQNSNGSFPSRNHRYRVRVRSYQELNIFNQRWRKATDDDKSWRDPFQGPIK